MRRNRKLFENRIIRKDIVASSLRWSLAQISKIDGVINGLADLVEEYEDEMNDIHYAEIDRLRELQEEMESIMSDIYNSEQ